MRVSTKQASVKSQHARGQSRSCNNSIRVSKSGRTSRARELAASLTQLEETERRFRLLVESVTDYAIYMLDPDGHVINWNPGAARAKGYAPHEIIGRHFSTFYTPEDLAAEIPQRALRAATRNRKVRGRRLARAQGWKPLLGKRRHQCDQGRRTDKSSGLPRSRATSPKDAPRTSAPGRRRRWKASASSPAASRTISIIF